MSGEQLEKKCYYCGGEIPMGSRMRIVMGKEIGETYDAHPGCADAAAAVPKHDDGSRLSTFQPFTTMHLSPNCEPIHVQSLRHLRHLESEFGVQSHAYNFDRPETSGPPRSR